MEEKLKLYKGDKWVGISIKYYNSFTKVMKQSRQLSSVPMKCNQEIDLIKTSYETERIKEQLDSLLMMVFHQESRSERFSDEYIFWYLFLTRIMTIEPKKLETHTMLYVVAWMDDKGDIIYHINYEETDDENHIYTRFHQESPMDEKEEEYFINLWLDRDTD
jgi:hypothetical protein